MPTAAVQAEALASKDYYTVKKGDTLYGIALDHGQDYREIAAWNNLENVNVIKIGQVLRITPPEAPVVVKPVAPPDAASAAGAPAATDVALKRDPKGGKVAYSEQALAAARGGTAPPASVAAAASPGPSAAPSGTERLLPNASGAAKGSAVGPLAAVASAQPAPPAPTVKSLEDGIEWSWPHGGKLLTPFSEGGTKGIDIAGRSGDPVQAAASGRVLFAGNQLRGYGNMVIIKHDGAYLSAYAHNSQILVKEGQTVSRGQRIAELGDSDADRPKLHFEIRRQGKPVDPLKHLPQR